MRSIVQNLKGLLRVGLISVALFLVISEKNHAYAQTNELDTLFDELQMPENDNWEDVEKKIWSAWSKSGSKSMDYIFRRGITAMETGRLESAVGHFSTAIDHAPDFAEAWNKRATVFYMMDELGLSLADIQQTLVLNPRHFGAMAGLGSILIRLDRKSDALAVYKRAFEVHPHQENIKEAIERLEAEVKGTSL